MTQTLKAALAAFLLTGAGLAEATTLTLVPTSGMLSGLPGQRVGWGFSLFNDSGWDLYVTAVSADGSLYGTAGTSALALCLAALGLARERQRGRNGHARS